MSCLRRLELKWRYGARDDETPQAHPLPPASEGEVVSLPELTDLIFYDPVKFLEMLVAALAMPSLQRLDAEIWPGSLAFTGVKHLFKFICDTQSQFIAVCIGSLQSTLEFSAEASPKFDHVQTLKITFSRLVPRDFTWVQIIGNVLSEHLSTVEELIVEWHEGSLNWLSPIQKPVGWIFQPLSAGEKGSGAIRIGAQCCAFPRTGRPLASSQPRTSQGTNETPPANWTEWRPSI